MKYIIEGIDGTGKTTLANDLVHHEQLKILHASHLTENTYDWHVRNLNDPSFEVYDRFFIGEWVWSKVYNRECKLSDDQIQILIDSFDGIFIYCLNTSWKKELNDRGQKEEIPDKELALKIYDQFFKRFDFSNKKLFVQKINSHPPKKN